MEHWLLDFLDDVIIDKHFINKEIAKEIVKSYMDNNIYLEFYTEEGYYVQKNEIGKITAQHTAILHREPIIVDSLLSVAQKKELIKIMPITNIPKEQSRLEEIFKPYKKSLSLQWGI